MLVQRLWTRVIFQSITHWPLKSCFMIAVYVPYVTTIVTLIIEKLERALTGTAPNWKSSKDALGDAVDQFQDLGDHYVRFQTPKDYLRTLRFQIHFNSSWRFWSIFSFVCGSQPKSFIIRRTLMADRRKGEPLLISVIMKVLTLGHSFHSSVRLSCSNEIRNSGNRNTS